MNPWSAAGVVQFEQLKQMKSPFKRRFYQEVNAVEGGNNTSVQSSMKQFLLFPSSHHYIAICCRFRLTPTLVASFFSLPRTLYLALGFTVVGRKLAQLVFYDHLPSYMLSSATLNEFSKEDQNYF